MISYLKNTFKGPVQKKRHTHKNLNNEILSKFEKVQFTKKDTHTKT
jgi:hypothetical protein